MEHEKRSAGGSRGVFIAGTDTGIGKTHVSVALIHALRDAGWSACGMKPVASGCDDTPEGRRNADAVALRQASAPVPPYDLINPVALSAPVSPHLALAQEGGTLDWQQLQESYAQLQGDHARIVVEGIGGWMVPLDAHTLASAIPQRFGLPVILVVGLRLGCINHALLSARTIQADGCRLLGWIGNVIDPDMLECEGNVRTLREGIAAPCLGITPHGESAADAATHLAAAVAAWA